MMCHPIQECRCHLGITINTHPFRELKISGDDACWLFHAEHAGGNFTKYAGNGDGHGYQTGQAI